MMRRWGVGLLAFITALAAVTWVAGGTTAELYFSSDKNGEHRVAKIQEGDSVWLVIADNDENLDCDIRDKFWTDVKLMDPKTGANVDWESWEDCIDGDPFDYVGRDGCVAEGHFFEETGADTGLFVSNASFQIGRRIHWRIRRGHTHWVGFDFDGYTLAGEFFHPWLGDFYYFGDLRDTFDVEISADYRPFVGVPHGPWHGWFENMDTLIGLIQDPNDPSDVAIAMLKIDDSEGAISWDQETYPDGNEAAVITVIDPDENLSCSVAETVPVFVLVNPGSWNPVQTDSPTTFCMLWRNSGVFNILGDISYNGIWPLNIYDTEWPMIDLAGDGSNQPNEDGTYYIEYPTANEGNVVSFDTSSNTGITRVMFYAEETGLDTGVFEFRMNSLLRDLGFRSLRPRDVLAAYYLDPNDFDDFKVATAHIEERQHSITRFTDADREDQEVYAIGHDPIYVQVIDANANVDPCCPEQVVVHLCTPHEEDDSEWWILDETSSSSAVFFSHSGLDLAPIWEALGLGEFDTLGGYQMVLDNWRYEVFNEDDILARYNDVQHAAGELPLLGDSDPGTAFPPRIASVRAGNDVSFDMASISDTQVFDGERTQMWFLDRHGNRVSEYVSSDCVFVEVLDPDQNEDALRRERVDGYWADIENAWPFAPEGLLFWECGPEEGDVHHDVNDHLGTVSIFSTRCGPKVYVLNPRNGYWAAVDLLETGTATGDFVSVTCLDLASVHPCVPTLRALPGDTILAVYQDPTNHSDSAWISIKVGVGGGSLPGQSSTIAFVDDEGAEVTAYTDADTVYVRVVDRSHVGEPTLAGAVEIDGVAYDLTLWYENPTFAPDGVFMTDGINLDLVACTALTATYTDPTDPTDTSSDTVPIIASELEVVRFHAVPSPFDAETMFTYEGSGVAATLSVDVFDLSGKRVWSEEAAGATGVVWDGTNDAGGALANGAFIYVIAATDGTNAFTGKGVVFILR